MYVGTGLEICKSLKLDLFFHKLVQGGSGKNLIFTQNMKFSHIFLKGGKIAQNRDRSIDHQSIFSLIRKGLNDQMNFIKDCSR
jgi:hypothetical protein